LELSLRNVLTFLFFILCRYRLLRSDLCDDRLISLEGTSELSLRNVLTFLFLFCVGIGFARRDLSMVGYFFRGNFGIVFEKRTNVSFFYFV
jgi:hypothetical protein